MGWREGREGEGRGGGRERVGGVRPGLIGREGGRW